MPFLTHTGTWSVTECPHCNKLFTVQSDDTWAAYELYKEHMELSPFCQKNADDAKCSLFGRKKPKHNKDNVAKLSTTKEVTN